MSNSFKGRNKKIQNRSWLLFFVSWCCVCFSTSSSLCKGWFLVLGISDVDCRSKTNNSLICVIKTKVIFEEIRTSRLKALLISIEKLIVSKPPLLFSFSHLKINNILILKNNYSSNSPWRRLGTFSLLFFKKKTIDWRPFYIKYDFFRGLRCWISWAIKLIHKLDCMWGH